MDKRHIWEYSGHSKLVPNEEERWVVPAATEVLFIPGIFSYLSTSAFTFYLYYVKQRNERLDFGLESQRVNLC